MTYKRFPLRPNGAAPDSPQFLGWLDRLVTELNAGNWKMGTALTTTTGNVKSFTGQIPDGARKVTMSLNGISAAGTGLWLVQLGTDGTYVTSGYIGGVETGASPAVDTTGFLPLAAVLAASTYSGTMTFHLADETTYEWTAVGAMARHADGVVNISSGRVTLAGNLNDIQLIVKAAANDFDLGAVNVSWEI